MSARDDLSRFDAMWEHHCKWRDGSTAGNDDGLPGDYVKSAVMYSLPLGLTQQEFDDACNKAVYDLVDGLMHDERRRLRLLARAEAEATLRDLKDEAADAG